MDRKIWDAIFSRGGGGGVVGCGRSGEGGRGSEREMKHSATARRRCFGSAQEVGEGLGFRLQLSNHGYGSVITHAPVAFEHRTNYPSKHLTVFGIAMAAPAIAAVRPSTRAQLLLLAVQLQRRATAVGHYIAMLPLTFTRPNSATSKLKTSANLSCASACCLKTIPNREFPRRLAVPKNKALHALPPCHMLKSRRSPHVLSGEVGASAVTAAYSGRLHQDVTYVTYICVVRLCRLSS